MVRFLSATLPLYNVDALCEDLFNDLGRFRGEGSTI